MDPRALHKKHAMPYSPRQVLLFRSRATAFKEAAWSGEQSFVCQEYNKLEIKMFFSLATPCKQTSLAS
jgi:hypothetical protein